METLSALLSLRGESTGHPHKGASDSEICLNKLLSKPLICRCFETSWRLCEATVMEYLRHSLVQVTVVPAISTSGDSVIQQVP